MRAASTWGLCCSRGTDTGSWLRITAGRVDETFSSDTKSTGFSDQADGDDQERVTEDVYGENWGNGLSASGFCSDYYACAEWGRRVKPRDGH